MKRIRYREHNDKHTVLAGRFAVDKDFVDIIPSLPISPPIPPSPDAWAEA